MAKVNAEKHSKRESRGSAALTPALAPAAALSFLKDTRGMPAWTVADMQGILRITKADAEKTITLLAMQGYVAKDSKSDSWFTTAAGNSVAGSATPSFAPEVVEKALRALEEHVALHNRASKGGARVSKAIAYGDFLLKLSRVQAADVGIELSPLAAETPVNTARNEQRKIFQELRAKSRHFRLLAFLPWMKERSHLALVPKTPKAAR